MYRAERRPGLGAVEPATSAFPFGVLRAQVAPRLERLATYDRFLRDRTVFEWLTANPWLTNPLIGLAKGEKQRQLDDEAAEFWGRLGESEKRTLVESWIRLVDAGKGYLGQIDAGQAKANAPAALSSAIVVWARAVDAFASMFDKLRQKIRAEARTDPHPTLDLFGSSLRNAGMALGIGLVGLLALGAFLVFRQPQLILPSLPSLRPRP